MSPTRQLLLKGSLMLFHMVLVTKFTASSPYPASFKVAVAGSILFCPNQVISESSPT